MKKAIAGLILALGLCANTYGQSTNPQISLELIKSKQDEKSFVRPTITKPISEKMSITGFLELYGDGESYYGKTTASYKLNSFLSGIAQVNYGNGFNNRYGLGLAVTGQFDKLRLKAYTIPQFWEIDGKRVPRSIVGYSFGLELPYDFKLSGFGDINLNGKKGAEWSYGEIGLEKMLSKEISIGYNAGLYRKEVGKLLPQIDHKISAKWVF